MNGKKQIGVVAASSVEDYEKDRIKKHEKTLPKKELDRTSLTNTLSANTGPVFLTFKDGKSIEERLIEIAKKD